MLQKVFNAFGLTADISKAVPFGSGLINHTWKVNSNGKIYILQRINQQVFKKPADIACNITVTAKFLQQHYPQYLFVTPERSVVQEDTFFDEEHGYFRLSPFVENSHTIDVVNEPQQAYEAAAQFGKFTKLLAGFDATKLKITLPDFHNLSLRFLQFEQALANGNAARIAKSEKLIATIVANRSIVELFEKIENNPHFKLRATHHDTKISNVLFDENDKGLCVIDLDTLMPGYFISDVGDMMRTYLSPVSEEEKELPKIEIRDDFFKAIAAGYLGQMGDELTAIEKEHFVYAGKFMIYMQAIRFITDYINNDIYYGSKYEGHNFVRASNQLMLLQKLVEKENSLQQVIKNFSSTKLAETTV
ncbi:phosphotransferase enzyme family protein [Ferruginibacter sp.]|nr:aminoglycoside phosphotransferase family protein [Ferruginibacter sp.]